MTCPTCKQNGFVSHDFYCGACGKFFKGSEWISVKDRLPTGKDEIMVLAYFKGEIYRSPVIVNSNFIPAKNNYGYTHWMPLPPPPPPPEAK